MKRYLTITVLTFLITGLNAMDNQAREALYATSRIDNFRFIHEQVYDARRFSFGWSGNKPIYSQHFMFRWKDNTGKNTLHFVIQHGQKELAQAIVQRYFDLLWEEKMFTIANPLCAIPLYLMHTNPAVQQDNDGKTSFHAAIERGDAQLLETLLSMISSPGDVPRDNAGKTLMHSAALAGNAACFNILRQRNFGVHDLDNAKRTTLHLAVQGGNETIINALLDLNVDTTKTDLNGDTALHLAALYGRPGTVQALLKHGNVVDPCNNFGHTPFIYALDNGHVQTMEALLAAGANINSIDPEYKNDPRGGGKTALHRAAIENKIDAVNLLVEHGADLNILDKGSNPLGVIALAQQNITKGGRTALYYAIKHGHMAIIDCLLNHYADIEKTGDYCKTPLQKAAARGYGEVLHKLLVRCAIVDRGISSDANLQWLFNIVNGVAEAINPEHLCQGMSFIFSALGRSHDLFNKIPVDAVPESLINAALEPIQQNIALTIENKQVAILHALGMSALARATIAGNENTVRLLLLFKANVALAGFRGMIPLHSAAKHGHLSIVDLLLKEGSPVDKQDDSGMTPLHYAARYGHLTIIDRLLGYSANILARNKLGKTPLHEACENKRVKIAKFLLERRPNGGARVLEGDIYGNTPLHYAAANGDTDLIQLIQYYNPRESLHRQNANGKVPYRVAIESGHPEVAYFLEDPFNMDLLRGGHV